MNPLTKKLTLFALITISLLLTQSRSHGQNPDPVQVQVIANPAQRFVVCAREVQGDGSAILIPKDDGEPPDKPASTTLITTQPQTHLQLFSPSRCTPWQIQQHPFPAKGIIHSEWPFLAKFGQNGKKNNARRRHLQDNDGSFPFLLPPSGKAQPSISTMGGGSFGPDDDDQQHRRPYWHFSKDSGDIDLTLLGGFQLSQMLGDFLPDHAPWQAVINLLGMGNSPSNTLWVYPENQPEALTSIQVSPEEMEALADNLTGEQSLNWLIQKLRPDHREALIQQLLALQEAYDDSDAVLSEPALAIIRERLVEVLDKSSTQIDLEFEHFRLRRDLEEATTEAIESLVLAHRPDTSRVYEGTEVEKYFHKAPNGQVAGAPGRPAGGGGQPVDINGAQVPDAGANGQNVDGTNGNDGNQPQQTSGASYTPPEGTVLSLVFVGGMSTGKSSLANALIGYKHFPVKPAEEFEDREEPFYSAPGLVIRSLPGFSGSNLSDALRSYKNEDEDYIPTAPDYLDYFRIEENDIVVFVLDKPMTDADARFIKALNRRKHRIVMVRNKYETDYNNWLQSSLQEDSMRSMIQFQDQYTRVHRQYLQQRRLPASDDLTTLIFPKHDAEIQRIDIFKLEGDIFKKTIEVKEEALVFSLFQLGRLRKDVKASPSFNKVFEDALENSNNDDDFFKKLVDSFKAIICNDKAGGFHVGDPNIYWISRLFGYHGRPLPGFHNGFNERFSTDLYDLIMASLNTLREDEGASTFSKAVHLIRRIKRAHDLNKELNIETVRELNEYYRSVFPFSENALSRLLIDVSSPVYRKFYWVYLKISSENAERAYLGEDRYSQLNAQVSISNDLKEKAVKCIFYALLEAAQRVLDESQRDINFTPLETLSNYGRWVRNEIGRHFGHGMATAVNRAVAFGIGGGALGGAVALAIPTGGLSIIAPAVVQTTTVVGMSFIAAITAFFHTHKTHPKVYISVGDYIPIDGMSALSERFFSGRDEFLMLDFDKQILRHPVLIGNSIEKILRTAIRNKDFQLAAALLSADTPLSENVVVDTIKGFLDVENAVQYLIDHAADKLKLYKEKIYHLLQSEGNISHTTRELFRPTALDKLNNMIGLTKVKTYANGLVDEIKITNRRSEEGLDTTPVSRHMVFAGNPGTGKTEVARLMAQVLFEHGIIKKNNCVIADRAKLVGRYVNNIAETASRVIEDALGGVLFIDEAYSLNDRYGREVMDVLIEKMETYRDRLVVIVAGYPDKMHEFLRQNQGLHSRFTQFVDFEDYSDDELVAIFRKISSDRNYIIADGGDEAVRHQIPIIKREAGASFGNGREMRNLLERAISQQMRRLRGSGINPIDISREELQQLLPEDIAEGSRPEASRPEEPPRMSSTALARLNAMIGLDNVKEQIHSWVARMRYVRELQSRGLHVFGEPSRHMAFIGNPGTGKTEVAQLIADILRDFGMLQTNAFVTAKREDLVAEYVGQTAGKTRAVLERARGGVLFIDEAYSLSDSDYARDFGHEAITTLIAEMESQRDNLVVIVAGYQDRMARFFQSNPGLSSRIPTQIHFADYSLHALTDIFVKMSSEQGYHLAEGTLDRVAAVITEHKQQHPDDFGNARVIRNILEKAVQNIAIRLSDRFGGIDNQELLTLIPEDILTPNP